uniref:C2H2-type domain-containing protein n=1 Tax=Esox lucius TaxID=8010 RepID=A0AAY5KCF4_ESOLU
MDTVPLKHEISHTVVSALDLSTQEHLTAESSPVTVLPLETKRKRGRPKGSTKKGQGKTMNTNLGNASNSFSTRMMSTNEGLKDFTDCHQNAVTSDVDLLGTMSNESVSETDNVQNEEYIGKNIKKESDGLDNESEYNPKSSYAKTRGRPKGRPKGTGKTCEYCNRHFDFVSVYTVHLRTHTGERPYKCIDCDQDFAQLSNLKSHIKKHNKRCGRLMCPYCKIKFVNSKELLAHCKWHSSENGGPFSINE